MSSKTTKTAGGVVFRNGFIVLVSQNGDSWSLPKGHIDTGETAREAAEREIAEESGITNTTYIADLGTYKRYRMGKGGVGYDTTELKEITIFLYRTDQIFLKPTDSTNPSARWVLLNDAASLLSNKKDAEFLKRIMPQVKKHLAL